MLWIVDRKGDEFCSEGSKKAKSISSLVYDTVENAGCMALLVVQFSWRVFAQSAALYRRNSEN
jgi:hypothetical protein